MTDDFSRCSRCETPLETGDLRCAICGQAAPARAPVVRDVAVRLLRCGGCGAAVEYDPAVQAPRCAFCGEVLRVEAIEDPPERIEFFLPFTADADAARAGLGGWFRSLGFFHPRNLASQARLQALQPLWWVAWVFDAQADITWTADSNLGAGRSDWAPHAGRTPLLYDNILVSASRGLTLAETSTLSGTYDLATAGPRPSGAESATVEQFDVQRSLARRRIVEAIDGIATAQVAGRFCPGTKHRNVHVAVLLRALTTRRVAFPAWVMAYRYRDRPYRAVVSGQDAACIRADAPLSWARIAAVGLAAATALGGILAAILHSL
ncbi:MAG: hypothetical protein HY905_21330 [Deltaproteobacteria bacterium]|nr:hypothetical protein [Deltaproteobacteria bacterium]